MEQESRKVFDETADPVRFDFSSEEEFIASLNTFPCLDKCSCGGFNEISFDRVFISIGEYSLDFSVMPLLTCTKCGKKNLSEHAKFLAHNAYIQLRDGGHSHGEFSPKPYFQRFKYAEKAEYKYDHWDYFSIPGLKFDEEHSEEGFLTPVYFDKKVLVSFLALPEYEVDLFSESYGDFAKLCTDDSGYQYEWNIPFGINSNGKVVFWLGDLDDIEDETSINLLKAFNVPSDHQLTSSEFYQAQMCCRFSEPIAEKRIISNRNAFIKNVSKRYGVEISHLFEESAEHEEKIIRPILFSRQNVSDVINAFHKVLIEGIDIQGLKTLYEKLTPPEKRNRNYATWKSIKLIEGTLNGLSEAAGVSVDLASLMSPLYILNDFRILLDHLLAEKDQAETKNHIVDTLKVDSFDNQEAIYFEEIKRLEKLYTTLALLAR